ncbi:MAG: hypothetical protein LQ342_004676 [Letrouitia transgressa]|nr:MAG: hypothetical protein LQ342_004676 [Letrouitia transgressa]
MCGEVICGADYDPDDHIPHRMTRSQYNELYPEGLGQDLLRNRSRIPEIIPQQGRRIVVYDNEEGIKAKPRKRDNQDYQGEVGQGRRRGVWEDGDGIKPRPREENAWNYPDDVGQGGSSQGGRGRGRGGLRGGSGQGGSSRGGSGRGGGPVRGTNRFEDPDDGDNDSMFGDGRDARRDNEDTRRGNEGYQRYPQMQYPPRTKMPSRAESERIAREANMGILPPPRW